MEEEIQSQGFLGFLGRGGGGKCSRESDVEWRGKYMMQGFLKAISPTV